MLYFLFITRAALKGLTLQGLMFKCFILVYYTGFDVCMLYTCEGIDFVDLTGERIIIYESNQICICI